MKRALHPLSVAVGSALVAMTAGAAHADTPAATSSTDSKSGPRLEEVIVTAQKVEQSQQDVPVSVVALSAEALQKAAVLNLRDLQTTVPGLFIATNNQGATPTFAIRAAKADNGTADTVTAYIDDMPVVSTRAVANMMYDMASITTLKGPQGTLFGANSTGGAIIFRPNKPTTEFGGYAEVGVGNYGRQQVQGMINVPVNDVIQLRIAGEVLRRDGFIDNHAPVNGNDELLDDEHESARVSLRLKPTDALMNDLVLGYFREDDQSFQDISVAFRDRYQQRAIPGFFVPVDYARAGLIATGDRSDVAIGWPTHIKARIRDVVNTTTYELNDNISVKNVIGYQQAEMDTLQSYPAIPAPYSPNQGRNVYDNDQWTWEPSLDLTFSDGRLRNKTGLFFSEKNLNVWSTAMVFGLPFDTSGLTPTQVAQINAFYPIGSNSEYHREFRSRAVYTQVDYDLTDSLTAKVGVRYTWDEADYTAENRSVFGATALANYGINPHLGSCFAGLSVYDEFDPVACKASHSLKSDASSFNVTLENRYAQDQMVYATARGSYIVGGFNDRANPTVGMPQTFNPEKVVDFEVGLKADWDVSGRPLRTNVAAFYGNYKDQQRVQYINLTNGVTAVGVINAGASNFYGVELELAYQPTDFLELGANWSHLESEYTRYNALIPVAVAPTQPAANIDMQGRPMAQTPKDSVNVFATVNLPLPVQLGEVSSTLSYFWRSKTTARDAPTVSGTLDASGELIAIDPALDFRAYDVLPAFDLINLTVDWKSILGSRFDANAWVKNLADEKYEIYGSNQMLQFGYAAYSYGQPRTYGFSLRYSF